MSVAATGLISLPRTDNAMARFLDGGIPNRPEKVPERIVKAIEIFAKAMMDKGFWHGWFGDKSQAVFDDSVNNYLQLPNYPNKARVLAVLHSDLLNAVNYTKVPKQTLEEIATYCGYSVEWSDSRVNPIRELILIDRKPVLAMIDTMEKSLAQMKTLLKQPKACTADEMATIIEPILECYKTQFPKPDAGSPEKA